MRYHKHCNRWAYLKTYLFIWNSTWIKNSFYSLNVAILHWFNLLLNPTLLASFLRFIIITIILNQNYKEREWGRETDLRSLVHSLIPNNGQSWVNLMPRVSSWSPIWVQESENSRHPLLPPQAGSRELEWKWRSWDTTTSPVGHWHGRLRFSITVPAHCSPILNSSFLLSSINL